MTFWNQLDWLLNIAVKLWLHTIVELKAILWVWLKSLIIYGISLSDASFSGNHSILPVLKRVNYSPCFLFELQKLLEDRLNLLSECFFYVKRGVFDELYGIAWRIPFYKTNLNLFGSLQFLLLLFQLLLDSCVDSLILALI